MQTTTRRDATTKRVSTWASVLLLIGAGILLAWPRQRAKSAAQPVSMPGARLRDATVPRLDQTDQRAEVSGERAEQTPSIAESADGNGSTFVVNGLLVSESPLVSLADLEVRLLQPSTARGQGEPRVQRSDAQGHFRFEFEASPWKLGAPCVVTVVDSLERNLFRGSLPLDEELVLIVRQPVTLQGRIEFVPAHLAPEVCAVHGYVRSHELQEVPIFTGRAPLQVDGTFAIEGYVDARPAVVDLRIACGTFAIERKFALPTPDPRTELKTRVELARLDFRVRDALGMAVEGATVTVRDSIESAPSSRTWADLTDAEGRASLLVEPGQFSIAVTHDEFRSLLDQHVAVTVGAIESREWTLEARPHEGPRIRGRVVSTDGNAVAGAFVSATPWVDGLEWPESAAETRSADDGSFTLHLAGDELVRVQGYHKDWGPSDVFELRASEEELLLRIDPPGSVEAELDAWWREGPVRSGPIDAVLVDREHQRSYQEVIWSLPARLTEIPAGSYNLYVFAAPWESYGHATVDVEAGRVAHVRVHMDMAEWVTGQIVAGASNAPVVGAEVRIEADFWSDEVCLRWGRTTSDETGGFRLLAGFQTRPRLRVTRESFGWTLHDARTDEANRIVLPPTTR